MRSILLSVLFLLPMAVLAEGPDLNHFEAQLKKNPTNLRLREHLARAHFSAKRFDKVVELLQPYTNELKATSLSELAHSYRHKKAYGDEIRILNLILGKLPNNYDVLTRLGKAYQDDKKEEDAIASYRKAMNLKPQQPEAYDGLLDIFRENKNSYEARIVVQDMIKKLGPQKKFYNELCYFYSVDGFLNETVDACTQAIQKDPQEASNHVYLFMALRDLNQKEKAVESLNSAAKRFPASAFVQQTAGDYYFNEKNYSVALRYYQQAVAKEPNNEKAQIGLAESLFNTKQFKEALVHYIEACKQNKEHHPKFQAAAAKLRFQDERKWSREYDLKAYNCR